jgi:hypothetical protein
MKTFSFVFSGGLKKYKPIESETVKLFRIAQKKQKGLAYMNLMRSSKSELIKNKKPVRQGSRFFLYI